MYAVCVCVLETKRHRWCAAACVRQRGAASQSRIISNNDHVPQSDRDHIVDSTLSPLSDTASYGPRQRGPCRWLTGVLHNLLAMQYVSGAGKRQCLCQKLKNACRQTLQFCRLKFFIRRHRTSKKRMQGTIRPLHDTPVLGKTNIVNACS